MKLDRKKSLKNKLGMFFSVLFLSSALCPSKALAQRGNYELSINYGEDETIVICVDKEENYLTGENIKHMMNSNENETIPLKSSDGYVDVYKTDIIDGFNKYNESKRTKGFCMIGGTIIAIFMGGIYIDQKGRKCHTMK